MSENSRASKPVSAIEDQNEEGEKKETIYADAGDEGFRFIFYDPVDSEVGGLRRERGQGHLVSLVGRGGTGKSFLALQLVTHLLNREDEIDRSEMDASEIDASERDNPTSPDDVEGVTAPREHAAFYFTLEASPRELANQARQFSWGKKRFEGDLPSAYDSQWNSKGLHVVSIPSPVFDLSALILLLRQTIADQLPHFGRLTAIVIDPMGGVLLSSGLRNEISQLRELASSHHCFLFLLTEEHLFDRYHTIEHYSQTVVHLRHDPQSQPYRWLFVQKSRGQTFRSGHHQLEFHNDHGIRVYPSIQAQSAFAHDPPGKRSDRDQNGAKARSEESAVSLEEASHPKKKATGEHFIVVGGEPLLEDDIVGGSVLFLMGPPGTFKQLVATQFASLKPDDSTIYISFKAEIDAVKSYSTKLKASKPVKRIEVLEETAVQQGPAEDRETVATYFLDARSPLLTPEEVLSRVRVAIGRTKLSRAVIWGLRRLNDMPNFSSGKSVQFLEALVTLLSTNKITSLLVDWPDKERASTLPIVDLSQYILLTRVCRNPAEIQEAEKNSKWAESAISELWGSQEPLRDHATLLRVQRTREGFYRDRGVIFSRPSASELDLDKESSEQELDKEPEVPVKMKVSADFEHLWKRCGIAWEEDPGLVN